MIESDIKQLVNAINLDMKRFRIKFVYQAADNGKEYPSIVLESKFTRQIIPFDSLETMGEETIHIAAAQLIGEFLMSTLAPKNK